MSEPDTLHEDAADLSPRTRNAHRAIRSLMEELEAVDWYAQRVEATDDRALQEVLAHNRDEEKEHAAMVLEWLRRSDPTFDEHLRTYLFTEGNLLEIEEAAEQGSGQAAEQGSGQAAEQGSGQAAEQGSGQAGSSGAAGNGDLGIRSLRDMAGGRFPR